MCTGPSAISSIEPRSKATKRLTNITIHHSMVGTATYTTSMPVNALIKSTCTFIKKSTCARIIAIPKILIGLSVISCIAKGQNLYDPTL